MALGEKLVEAAATFTLRQFLGMMVSRRPKIGFGAPRQQAGWGPGQPLNIAWWHVPIFIPYRLPWHVDHIDHCQVFLHPKDQGEGIWMRWQSRDSERGVSELTLLEGRVYMVPVVWRDERADGAAFFTNESFLMDGVPKWRLAPGSNSWFRLEIRHGRKRERSPHRYIVRVPPQGVSNGHFSLEMDQPRWEST